MPRWPSLDERFWSRVDASEGCWPWRGSVDHHGYGRLSVDGAQTSAHRVAWYLTHGEWSTPSRQLDHLCRNRSCCNPAHLEMVTPRTNSLRGFGVGALNARKTHCAKGHPFSPENTRISHGQRQCLACLRPRQRAAYHRRKGSVQ